MKQNRGFQTSLACLQHPASLLAIALLLLNDHVLKAAIPSWMTGKLSDFAGLFFFPFLVAAGLSLLLSRSNLTDKQIGLLSFAIVAAWFTALKTTAVANHLTAQIADALLGRPSVFALDATDLIALSALLPAWVLWKRSKGFQPKRLAYVVLCAGAIAAMATSPAERTIVSVTNLAYSSDGILYAADEATFGTEQYPIAKSLDAGLSWERDYQIGALPQSHTRTYPIEVCGNLNACYRVTSNHQLESYQSASQDWGEVFPFKDLSVKANDIIIFVKDGKQYILVAIGRGGVLRRELPAGPWEIIRVINAGSW